MGVGDAGVPRARPPVPGVDCKPAHASLPTSATVGSASWQWTLVVWMTLPCLATVVTAYWSCYYWDVPHWIRGVVCVAVFAGVLVVVELVSWPHFLLHRIFELDHAVWSDLFLDPVLSVEGDVPQFSAAACKSLYTGWSLALGSTNVVMQLAQRPIGHGVARGLPSGALFRRPLKRARTTLAYSVIATFGSEAERLAMRREVGRQHRWVHSQPSEEVQYDAFDPNLQLWVAACMYRGVIDATTILYGAPSRNLEQELYRHAARFATTLQVSPEQWPADLEAFNTYWQRELHHVAFDAVTRGYLLEFASLSFLPFPFPLLIGRAHRTLTLGFLPAVFRERLGASWSCFDRLHFAVLSTWIRFLNSILPTCLRAWPLNLVLADTRRRLAAGISVV
jgi:uncharacterized protein (DUF2236 family)